MRDQLPKDWKWVKLGEVCEIKTGTTPPKSDLSNYGNDFPFFKPPHLWDGLINDTVEKLSMKGAMKARIVPTNTVLVTCIGNLGRTGFVKTEAAFNQQINAILENKHIDGKYIFYQAQSSLFKRQLEKLATGTTVSIVNKGNFETINIPLPPKSTQLTIVSKIEELFSELDKGIESLLTAMQQLKTYRQSVLKWAFEGKLTNGLKDDSIDLHDEHDLNVAAEVEVGYKTAKNQKSLSNQSEEEGELPKGWKVVKVEDVTVSLDNKRKPINKDERKRRIGDIPYFGANGLVGWIDDYIFDEPLVCVVEDETFVGRKIPFSYKITGKTWVNNHAHVLRPKDDLNIDFLNYQLFYYPFLRLTTGTTGRKKLTKNALSNAPIRICSMQEQMIIVQEIESRLSVADKMEEDITQSLKQAEALRQSILKKAFEGRLV